MKYLLLLLMISLMSCQSSSSQSQTTNPYEQIKEPDLAKINQYITLFFKKYKEEGSTQAVDYIFSTNKLLSNSIQLKNLKSKLDSTRQLLGSFNGQELITKRSTSSSLVLISYLAKHQNQPIRFTFMFYKPENDWMLYKFKFDDEVDSELEESGKIYFIK